MSDESKKAQDSNNDVIESSEESGSIENNLKPKLAGSVEIKSHDLSEINKLASLDLPPTNTYELQTARKAFQKANEAAKAYEGINIGEAFQKANEASKTFERPDKETSLKKIAEFTKRLGATYIDIHSLTSAKKSLEKQIEINPNLTDSILSAAQLVAPERNKPPFLELTNFQQNQLEQEKRVLKEEKEALVKEKETLIKEKEVVDSELLHFETLTKIHEENIKEIQNEKEKLLKEKEKLLGKNIYLNHQNMASSEQIQALINEKNELTVEKQNLITEKVNVEIEIDKLKSLKSDLNRRSEIANSAKAFMDDEITIRRLRRDSYQNIAHAWSIGAAFLIILGLGLFYDQYDLLNVNYILKEGISIPVLTSAYLLLKAGFFISAFGIAIQFCMVFRDKLMLEASKENEKIDSMSYSKFYIDTYAETSTREQVTEALSGWNKSNLTTSKDNTEEAEPPLNQDLLASQNLKSISDLIQGLIKSNGKESKPEAKPKEKAE